VHRSDIALGTSRQSYHLFLAEQRIVKEDNFPKLVDQERLIKFPNKRSFHRKIVASLEPARFSKRQQISANVSKCQQMSAYK
jgi:hypothetical protein